MEDPSGEGGRESKMIFATITVVTLTVLTLALMFTRTKSLSGKRLPPGPNGWPVLGSLPLLSKLPHQPLLKIAQEYGPLVFMHLGSVPTLVVSNSFMAKEVLKTFDRVFSSRPDHVITTYLAYNQKDIGFAPYGPHWRQVRKVCTLGLFTASRLAQFQGTRQRGVLAMLQSIFKEYEQGNALKMNETLSNLTMNVMTQMMWKKSYSAARGHSEDADAIKYQDMVRETFALLGAVNIADFVPMLKSLSMSLQGYDKRMRDCHHTYDVFLQNIIDDHLKAKHWSDTTGAESEDFVDILLNQTKVSDPLSMESVKAILWDMINAGTETSSTAMEWVLVELVRHPVMMRKVQDELNSVVGPNRLPAESDIPGLKYLNAVIKEAFRLHPPLPLLVPRKSMQDCEIAGYHIPEGTLVFVNVYAVHRDPQVWEKPMTFNPDRFLKPSVNIDVKGQDYELLPFGSGRRMCPAMNMGHSMVQYSLAQLLHAFDWSVPGNINIEQMDMSESLGISCPKAISLTVFAKPRLATHVIFPASA